MRKKTAVVILFSLIFSILLSCLALMREIFVFNSARMTNDIFRNNGYQEVTFYLENNSAETKAKLTKNIKDELRQYGLHPKGLMDALLLQDRISIIPSETGMYSFAGFLFYSENSYELLAGSYPQNEEVMITDFAADSLLLQNDVYHSYEDILSSGITLQGYPLFVSGIVQTDYHQYDACFQSESADPETMTQKSEYLHKKNDFYARILIPEKPIEVTIANGSYPFYLNGQKILQLKTDVSAPLLEEGTIHINTACANLGYRDSMLFSNYGYHSIIMEEESTIPTVYLHPKDFEAIIQQSQLYDGLVVELSEDFTPIATLLDNQYYHYSAISQSINDFNWTITTLADLSQLLVGILLFILILFAFLAPILLGKSLDRFCGLIKSWGAGWRDIFGVESSFIFFIGGCISIIFLLGNTGITYLFSLPLSATFNINLRGLIQVSPARSFFIVGIGLVALVPYALILAVIRYRRRTLRQITA